MQKVHRTIPTQQSAIDEKRLRFFAACPYSEERRRAAGKAARNRGIQEEFTNFEEEGY